MTDEPEIEQPKPAGLSEFSTEVLTAICERMSDGESLREICDKSPDLPSRRTILRWVKNDDAAKKIYDEAQQDRMHWYADEIVNIAYDTSNDTIKGKDGQDLCNHEWIARSRLKVDSLKFLMSKLAPRTYGDKLPEAEEQKNGDLARLMQEINGKTRTVVRWERDVVSPIHDDDGNIINANDNKALRKRIAELEEQLGKRDGKSTEPPRQITYDPGPLPSRIDPEVLARFLRMIKGTVPRADQRPAEQVLDEVLSACEETLRAKYGVDQDANAGV